MSIQNACYEMGDDEKNRKECANKKKVKCIATKENFDKDTSCSKI